MSKHWSMALLESMKDPNLKILSSDMAVVIKDKYPKAKYHFLVLPFVEIPSIFQLSKTDLSLIDELELLGKNAIEVTGQPAGDFKMGFHASPSMQRLHLHVISKDFDSPSLKTKHHWNSFNTEFFLSCNYVRSTLEQFGRVEKWSDSRLKELKDTPLICNQCDYRPKHIPDLKQHLIKHLKSLSHFCGTSPQLYGWGNESGYCDAMIARNLCSAAASKNFETLSVSKPSPFVAHVELNRPDKFNALNYQMWVEIGECFNHLNDDKDCRAIVVSAKGKHFTAGLDLTGMMKVGQDLAEVEDVSRKGRLLEKMIKLYQDSISSLETCVKPVITTVHSACVGAGVDFITAADIRYCTKDAWFQVKEVDIGMAADVGTLQRLPKAIGSQSLVRELCYTARKMQSDEAVSCGLVSRMFESKEEMVKAALALAEVIAEKSPLAVQTTKASIVYSMDHTNEQGLSHIREINKMNLQSEDFLNACMAQLTKGEKPVFSKL